MVRPDKSPDADDAADRPTLSPLKTSKADGVGPARSLCFVYDLQKSRACGLFTNPCQEGNFG
jgi:hypothetical protein